MTGSGQVLAHGVGTRTDLPIPLYLALYGAGFAVLVSFAMLLVLWRRPKLGDDTAGRPLPEGLQRVLDASWFRLLLQAFALAVTGVITAAALFGPPESTRNVSPWALYITFWVGLVPVSLLLGPIWRVVNPLRLLHRLLSLITGPAPAADRLPNLGLWPGAVALLVFVWLELVYPERSAPSTVGLFLVVYSVVQLIAALWFGAGWFARGEAFEIYSALIGRLSPWGRREDGRLVLRNPLTNARTLHAEPGLAAVVVIVLGSTAFDGLTRTEYWQSGPGIANDTTSGTLGLIVMIGLVGLFYVLATRLTGRLGGQPAFEQPRQYAHTIIPIAVGYTIAHYFSLLALDGQLTYILASNPFGADGTDLFGTYSNSVDFTAVSTDTIAYVQVGAVVIGHVLGVILSHEQALRTSLRSRASDQLPLVAVMVMFTVFGLGLLFGF